MSFDWSEYLNLAKEFAGETTTPANQEAKLRVSISRSYYAAFNLIKDFLQDKEDPSIPTTGDAHRYFTRQFKLSPDPVHKSLGYKLTRMRLFRNQADYVALFPGVSAFTKRAIKLSEKVIYSLNIL